MLTKMIFLVLNYTIRFGGFRRGLNPRIHEFSPLITIWKNKINLMNSK